MYFHPSSTSDVISVLKQTSLLPTPLLTGFTEICIMHPLDVVKTRFQIQTTGKPGDPNYYTSVYDCMRKMARNEGVLSLYKGVLPPVLVETPKRAVKVR